MSVSTASCTPVPSRKLFKFRSNRGFVGLISYIGTTARDPPSVDTGVPLELSITLNAEDFATNGPVWLSDLNSMITVSSPSVALS